MDRKFVTLFGAALLATAENAQTQAGAQTGAEADANVSTKPASANASASSSRAVQTNGSNATIADGTAINAALSAPVDSKKAKTGDEVTARTTEAVKAQGKTVVPKGAKLVGHVTRASARSRGDAESALGIALDKAILKNGQEVGLNGSIQALASAETAANAAGDLDAISDVGAASGGRVASGGRGALGGVTSTAGGAVGTVANTAGSATNAAGGAVDATARTTTGVAGSAGGAVGGLNAAGQFASNSRGVFGLNGLNLNAAGSRRTESAVIPFTGEKVCAANGNPKLIVYRLP